MLHYDLWPIPPKIFIHRIRLNMQRLLERYCDYFTTNDNQFGFKKEMSCGHAIYTLRSAIDYYVNYGTTVNVCSIDLSKAFYRMNHYALFLKLIDRNIPSNFLSA